MLREDYLRQHAFDDVDGYTSLKKQGGMLSIIMRFAQRSLEAVKKEATAEDIGKIKVRDAISRMKEIKESDFAKESAAIREELEKEFDRLAKELASGMSVPENRKEGSE